MFNLPERRLRIEVVIGPNEFDADGPVTEVRQAYSLWLSAVANATPTWVTTDPVQEPGPAEKS